VFVTVCTKHRAKWLTSSEAHRLLVASWTQADAWLVGDYVLMPDHLHLFAAPRDLDVCFDRWL
jgi:REP element-mobilizing transposase RayT